MINVEARVLLFILLPSDDGCHYFFPETMTNETRQNLMPQRLQQLIRDVPDFPKPGILFKDITPLLADAEAFEFVAKVLADRVRSYHPTALVAIESRGFIFGAVLARRLNLPLQLVRKPGKLPRKRISAGYQLEYNTDTLEMHHDAVSSGDRLALIDDLLATGGTAEAAVRLVRQLGGEVCCAAFLIELALLKGRQRLPSLPVESLIVY